MLSFLTIGIVILAISTLGYFSNWLNWRFLNYKINYLLYYLGALVHESSHALLCLLTGAKITEYKVFVKQPRVGYVGSRLPIVGNLLISIAPILGGLAFLFFINKYFLVHQFTMPAFSSWRFFLLDFWKLLKQINLLDWRNIVALFLFLNVGAMLSPSWQDLKNVRFLIIILMFFEWPFFAHLGLMALAFILINITFQAILISIIYIFKLIFNK